MLVRGEVCLYIGRQAKSPTGLALIFISTGGAVTNVDSM
jgi:hypothetical protein